MLSNTAKNVFVLLTFHAYRTNPEERLKELKKIAKLG